MTPTLLFLTVLWAAGLIAWLTDRRWPWTDTPAAVFAVVIAGTGAGLFIAAAT
jgi:hypothetical protein